MTCLATLSPPIDSLAEVPALGVGHQIISLKKVLVHTQFQAEWDFLKPVAEAEVIRSYASSHQLCVSEGELQHEADQFRSRHQLYKASDLYQWLASRRISPEEWKEAIEDQVLRRLVSEHIVPEAAVRLYFAEHKTEFDQVELSMCLVDRESVAREIVCQVRDGFRDFQWLARRFSLDTTTVRQGGYLGWVTRPRLDPPELAPRVFGAKPGDVLSPFLVNQQWRIFQVEGFQLADFEQVKPTIRTTLFQQWLERELQQSGVLPLIFDQCRMYPECEE